MQKVKQGDNQLAWQEFYDFYGPFIHRYGRQCGLPPADADDLVGQCFEELSRKLPDFDYDPSRGKFKSWLKKLTYYKVLGILTSNREGLMSHAELEQSQESQEMDAEWDRAWEQEVLSYCIKQARSEVSTRNYQVFQLSVIEGWKPEDIATSMQMTPEQVYRAKYKVLQVIKAKIQTHTDNA